MSQKNCSLAIDEERIMVQAEYEPHYEPELRILVNAGALDQDVTDIEGRVQISF